MRAEPRSGEEVEGVKEWRKGCPQVGFLGSEKWRFSDFGSEAERRRGVLAEQMARTDITPKHTPREKESYEKDAEAAMALSLGKPVIFLCDQEQRGRFYRDVHPLSRLIEFETGIAVGAMVTDNLEDVSQLIYRIFENRMVYYLEQPKPDFLRLKEKLTESVVRLQTNDQLLNETFWNRYHKDRDSRRMGVGST
jgi:hypothetical protein